MDINKNRIWLIITSYNNIWNLCYIPPFIINIHENFFFFISFYFRFFLSFDCQNEKEKQKRVNYVYNKLKSSGLLFKYQSIYLAVEMLRFFFFSFFAVNYDCTNQVRPNQDKTGQPKSTQAEPLELVDLF